MECRQKENIATLCKLVAHSTNGLMWYNLWILAKDMVISKVMENSNLELNKYI